MPNANTRRTSTPWATLLSQISMAIGGECLPDANTWRTLTLWTILLSQVSMAIEGECMSNAYVPRVFIGP
jgi:hypothetical protein